ncbi:MAG: hypothetical protein IH987_03015 [Planctomycetes bacterium]|nr:hypothetical protein [Planctomycetota bacterium]
MIKRTGFATVFVLLNCVLVPAGLGQRPTSPDVAVDLNEGIYLYLAGEEDLLLYEDAIPVLTSVLDRDPNNELALLFRALCHGELGLKDLATRKDAEDQIRQFDFVLETRQGKKNTADHASNLEDVRQRIAGYESSDDRSAEIIAEWNVALASQDDLEIISGIIENAKGLPDDHFENLSRARHELSQTATRGEKQHYEAMSKDIRALIEQVDDPEVVVRLLDVVADAKIARIHETIARDIVDGFWKQDESTGSPRQLRREAGRRFEKAAEILRTLIRAGLSGEQLYRAKFLLGVILYRQAVPLRGKKEPARRTSEQIDQLEESLALMKSLANDRNTPQLFAPYSAFYAGLILPFLAAEADAEGMGRKLTEAEEYLELAARLDLPAGQKTPGSMTNVVPTLVFRQREQISRLRKLAKTASPALNDIRLSLGLGINRDTNVELLGDNTALPRDISRDEDWGFSLITAVDWTRRVTEEITFGFQGRNSQLWHADVDEFDQQAYGGTIALQYQLAPKQDEFGPVFATLQYDYDYTLLGREAFLGSSAFRPSLRFFWDERTAETEFYFGYGLRNYFEKLGDNRFNRDGNYFTFGFFHRHKLIDLAEVYKSKDIEPWGSDNDEYLDQDDPFYPARHIEGRFLLEYGWDATDGDEFDQKRYVLGFGVGVPLPLGVDMDFATQFEWGDYSHGSLVDFHRRARRDFIQDYSLSFSRTFVLEPGDLRNRFTPQFDRSVMTIRAQASWTQDDSNVVNRIGEAVYSYDRWIYGVTVGFAFN